MILPKRLRRLIKKYLPQQFMKHYIKPFAAQRKQVPYNAKEFFTSYYESAPGKELSDGITVKHDYNKLLVQYHYNAVENSIIASLASRRLPTELNVLDIGSGAGHWIDFYNGLFESVNIVGVDIAPPSAEALSRKYDDMDRIEIINTDVSKEGCDLGNTFDVINAIGVIFHIVDDTQWRRAIANLATHLNEEGVILIGGQFGWITRNVGFHSVDTFSSWEDQDRNQSDTSLVYKRIRSLRLWKKCAEEAGLQVVKMQRTMIPPAIGSPENNILVLTRC